MDGDFVGAMYQISFFLIADLAACVELMKIIFGSLHVSIPVSLRFTEIAGVYAGSNSFYFDGRHLSPWTGLVLD